MFILLVSTLLVILSVQSSCGSEIIDGKEVVPHSLPYMALLEGEKGLACGGILISSSWVLTAAHCQREGIKTVLLGVHSVSKDNKDYRQSRNIGSEVIHPNNNPKSPHDNDLMLLKLDREVTLTKAVKPFPLGDTMEEPAAGTKCLVAGWGVTKNNPKKMSDVLMSASVFTVNRGKCANTYPELTRNMICAGSNGTNSADTCQGDSGGPLVCDGALVGVTSFGKECGLKDKPAVYAFLSTEKLEWIKKTITLKKR